MRVWVTRLLWGGLIAGVFFMLGFVHQYHLPKIERWLLQEIEKQSREQTPLRVWPESVQVAFFPPGLVLNKIRILPQAELKSVLAPASIEQAEVRINWFYLLTGRLRFSYIGIHGVTLKAVIKNKMAKSDKKLADFTYDFKRFSEIPVDEIEIENLTALARLEQFKTSVHMTQVRLNIENRSRNFLVDLEAPQFQVKWQEAADPLSVNLNTRMLFDHKGLRLSSFKVKSGNSFVVAAGTAYNALDLQTRLQLNLEDILKWERIIRTPLLPSMSGEIRSDLAISGPFHNPQLQGKLNGTNLKVAEYIVGQVQASGQWENGSLAIHSLQLQNSAGLATIKNLKWSMAEQAPLSAEVQVDRLEIGQLLKNINLPKVPLRLETQGKLKCSGPMMPNLNLQCEGSIEGKNLFLHSGPPEKTTIIDLAYAQAKGSLTITNHAIQYNADLKVGAKSMGRSSGNIDYAKGFQITYEADNFDFADIRNLANLKLEGSGKLKGTTEGNSKVGRLRLSAQAKNLWLEDYWLGNPEAELVYKSGTLNFNNLLGQAGSSRYNGNLSIHFNRHEIFLQAKAPYADLLDIKEVFRRKVNLPIDVGGTGSVDVKASGPLKFNQMSYQLRSAFYRGQIANEGFDQMNFHIVANSGQAKIEQLSLVRAQSVVEANGTITPQGLIDSVVVGRKLRLEESENITRLGMDLTGQIDMTMAIRGQLPQPTLDAHGRLSQLIIGDKSAEDSTFKLKLSQDRLEGGGHFIGDIVNADFVIPISDSAPFSLKVKTTNWNFANFFSIFSSAARQRDIQTNLSSVIELQSDKGGLNKASGEIMIHDLSLKRGALNIKNINPIRFVMNTGTLSSNPFSLEGEGGYLKGVLNEISKNSVKASLNGKIDLSLLTLFTPFLADLQGRLTLNLNFAGETTAPRLTGSAYVDQGIVRLKAFPHAFTSLRTDILFTEQGLNINSLRADLGGGSVTGEGSVQWLEKNKVPVDVKGSFTDTTLNVPEGFRTKGNGRWSMNGQNLPYTIAVNYDVLGGEITSEFQGANINGTKTIAPSSLLPKFLVQPTDQPILLDLNIQLKNPLPIRNSLIESLLRGKIKVLGPPTQPRLTGTITPAPGGKVFFRDVAFEIQNGFVEFIDDPPDNAKIYLTAQTEVTENVRDDSNPSSNKQNEYEISLLVQGRLKPQPKFTLTSLPALNEKEIVSLLALGMTPTSLDQSRSGTVAASNSVQYGAAILQKPLNKEVRNRLGVDMQITQTQATADTTSYPKFTFTKQVTPKLNASASRTVEKNPTNSAKMEYKLNRNLSVIGSWEGKESVTTQEEKSKDVEQSVFGLDLEFKVNFK